MLDPLPLQKVPIKGTVNADPKTVKTVNGEPLEELSKRVEENLQNQAKLTPSELDKATEILEKESDIWFLQKYHFSPGQIKAMLASIATIGGFIGFALKLKGCL